MTRGRSDQDSLVKLLADRFMSVDLDVEDGGSLAEAVALAAQQTFMVARVEVAWFHRRTDGEWTFSNGARIADFESSPEPLPSSAVAAELSVHQPLVPIGGQRGHSRAARRAGPDQVAFRLRWPEDDHHSVELRMLLDGQLLAADGEHEQAARRLAQELSRPVEDLLELVFLLRPLRRLARRQAELAVLHRVETLERNTRTFEVDEDPDLRVHLHVALDRVDEGCALLTECDPDDFTRVVSAIERVGRVVLHRVLGRLGVTRDPRRGTGHRPTGNERALARLVAALDAFLAKAPSTPAVAPVALRLAFHRRILASVHAPADIEIVLLQDILDNSAMPDDVRDRELRLFTAWAVLHQRTLDGPPRRHGAGRDSLGQMWRLVSETTQSWLPSILAMWTTEPKPGPRRRNRDPFRVEAVRNWLQLWFAWHLLGPELVEPPSRGLRSEAWQLRCSLALIMRECLRQKLHGGEPGYVDRPEWTLDALQALVDHHVRQEIDLDREHDIRGHLALVGDHAHPRGARFAEGHLQHVLDIYLTGHFLLSADVDGLSDARSPRASVIDLLASPEGHRASARERRDLLAAWSLASLYHDVGLTLFPEFRPPHDVVARQDRSVADGMARIRGALVEAGSELARTARQELLDAGIYDTDSAPGLARWIDRQVEEGRPDHALTGAWYLLRATNLVDGLRDEVAHAAARAVLLHGAPGEPIQVTRDPVSALLVLCDELFDWQPGGPTDSAHQEGRAPRRSRTASLRFPDLRVTVTDGLVPSLQATLEVPPDAIVLSPGTAPCWPRVEVTHVHPALLGDHVFPIWISVAQNIGRLKPSAQGFGPVIEVRGQVPGRVHRTAESTAGLLETVLLGIHSPWRARLQVWLDHALDAPVGDLEDPDDGGPPVEWRLIYPFPRPIARDDLRRYFGELRRVAGHVLLGWDVGG